MSIKEITRSKFLAMDPAEGLALIRDGVVIINDPPSPKPPRPPNSVYRHDFDAMTPSEKIQLARSGRRIIDAADFQDAPT